MKRRVLLGTLVAGTLDIVEVILFYAFRGVPPIRVLQGVAMGWLGRDAFRGGLPVALLGLVTHFFIAFVVVAVYALVARRIKLHPLIAGTIYGLLVYAVMNLVVLPLSASGTPHPTTAVLINGLFAHVFCVGIPTALVLRNDGAR